MRNSWGRVVVLYAALICTAASSQAASVASRYYVTPLEPASGGWAESAAWDINDYGQVVGWSGGMTANPTRATLWQPEAQRSLGYRPAKVLPIPVTPVSPGPNTTSGIAWSINNRGQISGYGGGVAFLFSPDAANADTGTILSLTSPTGTQNINGYKINEIGQVVGDNTTQSRGWTWKPDAPFATSGTSSIVDSSRSAFSVNDVGDIGGRGFFFRPTSVGGGSSANVSGSIYAINNNGLAVGNDPTGTNVVVWRVSDGPTPELTQIAMFAAPSPPISPLRTRATGVNDQGVVVGDVTMTATGAHGFAWTEDDGPIDLNTRLESHSSFGTTITGARDVNAFGQIAARVSIDADGNPLTTGDTVVRAAVLTPLIDGDVNIDRVVDFADLLIIAQNFSLDTANDWTVGDMNGDSLVGFDDLLLVAQNYGYGTTLSDAGSFAADFALVQALLPEPSLCTFVLLGLRRRR